MAFNPIGALRYLEKVDITRAKEEEEQNAREALAFEIAMKYGTDGLARSTSTKSGKGGSTSSNTATAALMKNYNLTDETLAPILASGDKTAAPKLLDILEKQRLKYENEGLTLPEEVVANILESAVVTQPTTEKLDIGKLEDFIGREMDSLYKELLKTQSTTPGSVFIPEPSFVETPSLEDLDRFEKRAIQFNLTRAQDERDMITQRISELQSVSETTNLTEQQLAEQVWLTTRLTDISDAITSYDNDNVTPLAGLYGTTYMEELRKSYPKFNEAPLNPALLNASRQEITVPNRMVAENLAAAGILQQGDVVLNMETGKKIRIGG
jgi:hypothetical protein